MTPRAGLYVHIPFCVVRCGYCDFATTTGQDDRIDAYLARLDREAALQGSLALRTVFVGGGTPTYLSPAQIDRLTSSLRARADVSAVEEFTFEANPESAARDTLSAYRAGGANRVSFGLQTSEDALLRRLGRPHTFRDFQNAFERARALGFDNINVDLIFGLPGQTAAGWRDTLETVAALAPEHISAYALKIEPGTRFAHEGVAVDNDFEADCYLEAAEVLGQHGYEHYEISNFARPGRRSRHNLSYWRNEETVGLGLSAASYRHGRRTRNFRQFASYDAAVDAGRLPVEETVELGAPEREREEVLLALRLREGVPEEQVRRLGLPVFERFVKGGAAEVTDGHYRLTATGWLLSNQLFVELV